MKEIIFKPQYSVKLWLSLSSPLIFIILQLWLCISDSFKDREMVFFLIVLLVAFIVEFFIFFKRIEFRSIKITSNSFEFNRYFFKPIIKQYEDFQHIRERMISFGNVGIMLYMLTNDYEIIGIIKTMMKQGELIEKPRTEKSEKLEEFGWKYFIASAFFIIVASVISQFLPYHLIGAQSDALLVYFIISAFVLTPFLIKVNKNS